MEQELGRLWEEAVASRPEAAEAAHRAAKVGLLRVGLRVEMGRGRWGDQKELAQIISQLQAKQISSYEDQVREHRLKEALRAKKELEDKLAFIADTITTLNSKPEDPPKPKIHHVMDKEARKLMLEAEALKKKESLEFAKRQMEIQRERQRRKRLQVQQMAASLTQHIEQDKAQRAEAEQRLKEEKDKRLDMLRSQAELRKEEIRLARERIKSHVVTKAKILMPELEQRKKELANKRLGMHQLEPASQGFSLYQENKRKGDTLENGKKSPMNALLPTVEEEKQIRKARPRPMQTPVLAVASREVLAKPGSASILPSAASALAPERPLSKPPIPRVKPKSNPADEQKREKLQEAVERFKATKSDWGSDIPSLSQTQQLSRQGSKASLGAESRLSEARSKGEDDVIASIRAKLSLQS